MKKIEKFWEAVIQQDADKLRTFFTEDAIIRWHNTNEAFNVEAYIVANCEYPNTWEGCIERIERIDNLVITVVKVGTVDKTMAFHATSFIRFEGNKIVEMDEYWGDDGEAPGWRLDKHIGTKIK